MKALVLGAMVMVGASTEAKAEEEYVTVHLWDESDFWEYRDGLLKWIAEGSEDQEQEAAKARELAQIAGALYAMNRATPKDIIESPDPVLAASLFAWGTQMSVDISRILDGRPGLSEAFQDELQNGERTEGGVEPLGLTPQTGFERALAGIAARRTWNHEGDEEADGQSTPPSGSGECRDIHQVGRILLEQLKKSGDPTPTGGDEGTDGGDDGADGGDDGTDGGDDGAQGGGDGDGEEATELPCGDTCDENSGETPKDTGDSTDVLTPL